MTKDSESDSKEQPGKARDNVNAELRLRGQLKLFAATMLMTQVLCVLFSYATNAVDANDAFAPSLVFACASSVLLSRWIVIDARRAWMHAHAQNYIVGVQTARRPFIAVSPDCPKRWFVIMYAEMSAGLNPKNGT
jgi:hypothetical protein